MYSVWLTTTYVFVTYANAAYFEISFFNKEIRNLAGTRAYIKGELIKKVETFRLLSEAITELDSVFRVGDMKKNPRIPGKNVLFFSSIHLPCLLQ